MRIIFLATLDVAAVGSLLIYHKTLGKYGNNSAIIPIFAKRIIRFVNRQVNGSPRTDGNTFCCLKEIEATLNKHGVESEIVQIGRKPVRMCINCGGCRQNNGAGCAFDDDMCSVMTVVRSYQALGRLYRGIICSTLRQYAMLGDAAAMTDGVTGNDDDRWIFTEDNPGRALSTAAQLAGAARVLRGFNDPLAKDMFLVLAVNSN